MAAAAAQKHIFHSLTVTSTYPVVIANPVDHSAGSSIMIRIYKTASVIDQI